MCVDKQWSHSICSSVICVLAVVGVVGVRVVGGPVFTQFVFLLPHAPALSRQPLLSLLDFLSQHFGRRWALAHCKCLPACVHVCLHLCVCVAQ